MVRLGKAGNCPNIGIWSVFVLFGWRFYSEYEMGQSDVITTLGNNKGASLQLLTFAKVSSTKDLINRQTCQGILSCLHLVTSQMASSHLSLFISILVRVWFLLSGKGLWVMNVEAHAAHCRMASTTITMRVIKSKISTKCEYTPGHEIFFVRVSPVRRSDFL